MMGLGACTAFLLMPPSKVVRDDGTQVATIKARGLFEELKANLEIFRDWKLLIMVCAAAHAHHHRPLLTVHRYLLFSRPSVFSYTEALSMHIATTCEHDAFSRSLLLFCRYHVVTACRKSLTTRNGSDAIVRSLVWRSSGFH